MTIYHCPVCKKSFSSISALGSHVHAAHPKKRHRAPNTIDMNWIDDRFDHFEKHLDKLDSELSGLSQRLDGQDATLNKIQNRMEALVKVLADLIDKTGLKGRY